MRSATLPDYSIDWGDAPPVVQAAWLGEGDFCRCYLVNASYVFRFAKHADASAAMELECRLLPILRDALPVAVPDVRFAGRCRATGHAMFGYPCLAGEPLERPVLEELPAPRQTALLAEMAACVRRLHALPLRRVQQGRLPTLDPRTELAGSMRQARSAIRPRLTRAVWRYYEDLLVEYRREPALHRYQPAVLHGDLSPDHVLADPKQGRLTGVIDFGDACIGDPAWDLIYLYEDYGPNTLNAFLEHYDPEHAEGLGRKIRLYQQLNNLTYCLAMLSSGDEAALHEALAILDAQAGTGAA